MPILSEIQTKPATQDEMKMNEMKRIAANDPVALVEHGKELY